MPRQHESLKVQTAVDTVTIESSSASLVDCEAINATTFVVSHSWYCALRNGNWSYAHSTATTFHRDALPIGWLFGPHGLNAIPIHIVTHVFALEQITKAIILISLFSAGLKLRLPITSRLWFLSLRLAFLSMLITVGLIALVGIFLFGLPAGIAILIGGILAPTDPVLASDVQVENSINLAPCGSD